MAPADPKKLFDPKHNKSKSEFGRVRTAILYVKLRHQKIRLM